MVINIPPALLQLESERARQHIQAFLNGYAESLLIWHVIDKETEEAYRLREPDIDWRPIQPDEGRPTYAERYGHLVDRATVYRMTTDALAYMEGIGSSGELWIGIKGLGEEDGWRSIGFAFGQHRNGGLGLKGGAHTAIMLNAASKAMGPAWLYWHRPGPSNIGSKGKLSHS